METKESTLKMFSNERKVFVCRVALLAPIVCILCVFLVLLICMEFLPEQNGAISDKNVCPTLNCTVEYENGLLNASCIKGKVINSTKMTKFNCLDFKVSCALGTADNTSINGSKDTRRSHGNSSWNEFGFCWHDMTELGFLQDTLVENGSNFIRESFTNDGPFNRSCSFRKVNVPMMTAGSICDISVDNETAKQKRMKENTSIVDKVLVALLSLGLVAFILMCVYTRKTLKVCCHLCYEDEI